MSRSFGCEVGDLLLADRDLAGGDLLEPGDHPQDRRLAAARGADEHHELAVADLQRDVVDRDDLVAEHLADVRRGRSWPWQASLRARVCRVNRSWVKLARAASVRGLRRAEGSRPISAAPTTGGAVSRRTCAVGA